MNVEELPWTDVVSSNLARVAHEGGEEGTLYVQFREDDGGLGALYEYADVPRDFYYRLVNAASPGSMLGKIIKGRFVHNKVDIEATDEDELVALRRRVEVLERDMANMRKAIEGLARVPVIPKHGEQA